MISCLEFVVSAQEPAPVIFWPGREPGRFNPFRMPAIKSIGEGPRTERKYTDPNGVPFDVATPEHARKVWCIPA